LPGGEGLLALGDLQGTGLGAELGDQRLVVLQGALREGKVGICGERLAPGGDRLVVALRVVQGDAVVRIACRPLPSAS